MSNAGDNFSSFYHHSRAEFSTPMQTIPQSLENSVQWKSMTWRQNTVCLHKSKEKKKKNTNGMQTQAIYAVKYYSAVTMMKENCLRIWPSFCRSIVLCEIEVYIMLL